MASNRLRDVLGSEPPPSVAALPDASRSELAALVEAALRTQSADIDSAIEGVLKHVPFPVRPIARKMLKG